MGLNRHRLPLTVPDAPADTPVDACAAPPAPAAATLRAAGASNGPILRSAVDIAPDAEHDADLLQRARSRRR